MRSENSTEAVTEAYIKLDQFLKLAGIADTGGQAKILIQTGEVDVNGTMEQRRGRKLVQGDRVVVFGQSYTVDFAD
jgi:ribosome-associated protein